MRYAKIGIGILTLLLTALAGNVSWGQEITPEVTDVVEPTSTATNTSAPTPTATNTPTWTAVVITQPPIIVTIPVIITQPAIVITQPPIVITQQVVIQQPVIVPLPTAVPSNGNNAENTNSNAPAYGWTRFESIAFIPVIGTWNYRSNRNASDGAYHESADQGALFRLPFDGDGIRLGFRIRRNGGDFHLRLDNETLAVFSTNSLTDEAEYSVVTEEYFIESGYHVLDIYISNLPEHGAIGIDFVEIFNGPPLPVQVEDVTGRNDVARVQLISSPPTPIATATNTPLQPLVIEVLVAYDENANNNADMNEGVRDISVRVLDAVNGDLLASDFTDSQGSLRLQIMTAHDVIIYIPVLGRSLNVRVSQRNQTQRWQVLLPAGNQPGLIP
jgi:hypothetical protein